MRSLRLAAVTLLGMQVTFGQLLTRSEEQRDIPDSEARRYISLMKANQNSDASAIIDATYYGLNLTITTSPNYLRGVVTLKVVSKTDHLASFTLDLSNEMTVDSVKVENSNVQFVQHPTTVAIELNRSYGFGQMVVLDIYYQGIPPGTGFGSFVFGSHGTTPWVWTLSEPYGARDWWPCNDHPLDKADSVDIHVTCGREFKVASNGKLLGVTSNPDWTHTYMWSERYPIATYLIFVSLTNYAEFTEWFRYSPTDSMPIVNYVLPENLTAARDSLSKVTSMLDIFSQQLGLYPFITEKYGHAEFGRGGAMEHQTMTSLTRSAFGEYVLAHELGHHWFGNLITCANWQHLWLNEGFASYCESIYAEGKYGAEGYRMKMHETMQLAKSGVGGIIKTDTTDLGQLFDQKTVYRKGASVLHMLRHIIGDTLFFQCLRAYVADSRFRFGVATSGDFQNVCESVSGRPLSWFFNQWLYGENFPQYSFSWSSRQATTGFTVTLNVSQTTRTNNPDYFLMPIDVRLSAAGWDTTVVIFNDTNPQQFNITTTRDPTSVALDPGNWILRDILAPYTLPASIRLKQNFPNPFNAATTIEYEIPRAVRVTLIVFNILGEEVGTLVNDIQYPGQHRVIFEAGDLPSGVYFYQLRSGDFNQARKCIIIR